MTTLKERLDQIKDASAGKTPPEAKAIMTRATSDLAASGIMDRLPKVGSPLPAFSLKDTDGNAVSSADLLARGPLVATFYRGRW